MVVVYILEGMGLIGLSDWIPFSINVMKSYTLVGGFSIGLCNCLANAAQYIYGYNDQLFQNAGIIMVIDAGILVALLVIYGIYRINNRTLSLEEKTQTTWIDKAWIFGKYYVLAFLLIFNVNVAFSSCLMLFDATTGSTSVAIVNVVFAAIVLAMSVGFFVMLFLWTKELSVTIVYPESKEKSSIGHDRSSLPLSDKSGSQK